MFVRRLFTSAAASAVMLVGLLPLAAPPAMAAGVIDFSESFTGTTITNPDNWAGARYSEWGSSAPCLTTLAWGAPSIPLGSGTLDGCGYDAPGSGALRLMENSPHMSATMIHTQPLPTANGMDITFRMAAIDTIPASQIADGISFFIKKGSDPDDVPGYRGGSLSYGPNLEYGQPGLPGALLGIGFDLYGNWSTNEAGGTGCATRGVGRRLQAIAIRGPGQGTTGYCYLAGTGSYGFNYYGSRRDRAAKDVRIVVDSAETPSPRVSVYVGPPGAVSATPITSVPLPKEFLDQPTFKFGFGGATGGLYVKGEVWNLRIKPVEPNPPTGVAAAWAGPSGGKETATVTWAAPTSGPTPTSYVATARRGTTVGGTCTAPAGTTTCTIEGLATTDYDITVVTVSGDSQSPPSAPVRISLAPVVITTASTLLGGTVGTHYAQSLAATGGNGPYTWTLASGSLPAGVTLDSEGTISGLPTVSGIASFSLTATDSQSRTATKAFTAAIVDPLLITTSTLPNGATGNPYSNPLAATGGTSYTWAVVSGALPSGLTLDAAGTISGNPSTSGSSTFTVRVTDGNSRTDDRTLALGIDQTPPVQITTASIPSVVQGEDYSVSLEATGGIGPYVWSLFSGSLPTGVSLVGGALVGTPSAAGSFPIIVRATDSSAGTPLTDDQGLTLVVHAPVEVTTSSLPSSAPGESYSEALAATGGDGVYTWSVTGDLPAGLSVDPASGVVSGSVSAAALVGSYPITVHAEDGTGVIASRDLVLTLTSPVVVVTTALPSGATGLQYGATLVATGGTGPYTWALDSGSLPTGLALGADGVITGTPTVPIRQTVTVEATDLYGATATETLSITIVQSAPVVVSISPPVQSGGGLRDEPLVPTAAYETTGFAGAPTYTITPALPAGLAVDPTTGIVSGTPSVTSASQAYTVTASGTGGRSATATLTLAIDAPEPDAVQITPGAQTATGTAWTSLRPTAELSAYGFEGAVTYAISPALPLGLSINPLSGSVSGIARTTASGTWTITGTDGVSSDKATLTLHITAKAQRVVPKLSLPRQLANPGCTVLRKGPATTNAGRSATITVTAAQGISRAGDGRADFRVIRTSSGRITVCVSGYRALTVKLTASAPAVPGYTGYRQTTVYFVRKVR